MAARAKAFILSYLSPISLAISTSMVMMTARLVAMENPDSIPYKNSMTPVTITAHLIGITNRLKKAKSPMPIMEICSPEIASICAIPVSVYNSRISSSSPDFSPRSMAESIPASLSGTTAANAPARKHLTR